MDKEEKNERVYRSTETEVFLQWGNRKRLRCVRVRGPEPSSTSRIRRKISSPFLTFSQPPTRLSRESETAGLRSSGSPEKEERCYTTRGSPEKENGKVPVVSVAVAGNQSGGENNRGGRLVCPKLYIALSSKEKEEDFMAMKGCKLPQRPKKRAKVIQRTLLLVSPGAWLTDMSIERYEVREKKSTKKRPRGLKAMGGMESDSE